MSRSPQMRSMARRWLGEKVTRYTPNVHGQGTTTTVTTKRASSESARLCAGGHIYGSPISAFELGKLDGPLRGRACRSFPEEPRARVIHVGPTQP